MDNLQSKLELVFASKTDPGKVRPNNEDNYLLEFWPGTSTMLAVVADGMGRITEEDIPTHPMRSVVNSCLGGKENSQFSVDPKWDSEELPVVRKWSAGDVLLLCSDGLNGEVSNQELTSLVQEFGESPEKLTEECVNKALEHGGNDNITVIAIANLDKNSISEPQESAE